MVQQDPSAWLGLLKWSMKYQDNTHNSEMRPLSEEDRKFLEQAMAAAVVDPARRMAEIVDALVNTAASPALDEQSLESVELLFDELQGFIENLDYAQDLHRMKKFQPLVSLLFSPHAMVRAHTAHTIGLVTQNDVQSQNNGLELGCLENLTHLAACDTDLVVRQKALFAVSCLIRNHHSAEHKFITEGDGLQLLTNNLDSRQSKNIQRRSLFLVLHLLRTDMARADLLPVVDSVRNLIELIETNLNPQQQNGDNNLEILDEDVVELSLQVLLLIRKHNSNKVAEALGQLEVEGFLARLKTTFTESAASVPESLRDTVLQISELQSEPQQKQSPQPQQEPQPQPLQETQTPAGEQAPAREFFVAEQDWKQVMPHHMLSRGLHIKMDMGTGITYAKLLDTSDTTNTDDNLSNAIVSVPSNQMDVVLSGNSTSETVKL
eukprot:c18161_g1_i1.p1 GENE.c18161_g1_i1~~c18161_g1_i1.p1  ORF type:complete len:453 (-),score=136.71 c18161_g1_i1:228-1532(-)